MTCPHHGPQIDRWVGEFLDTGAYDALPGPAKSHAAAVLPEFLDSACHHRRVDAEELETGDMRPGLMGVARLDLPADVRAAVPELCATFLAEMQAQGRLAGGRALGHALRALGPAYLEATSDTPAPIRNVHSPVGRNNPCPCGSGKKYKKCCMQG